MTVGRDAILLIGHGSVEDPSEIPDFVRTIRHGRPTPQSVIDEVEHRWKAIGGSPLLAITKEQAARLQERLGVPVAVGMRLWKPWAKDVVRTLAAEGIERVVNVPLAPFSTHVYNAPVEAACREAGIAFVPSAPWGEEPALIDAFATVTREALAASARARRLEDAHVLFTAHSLPMRVVASGDPYADQVRATAEHIARSLSRSDRWSLAFQSQGMDGGEWLGPDVGASFASIAAAGGHAVVVTAIGFLADHTEILWDLDVEGRALAEKAGLSYHRAASLNVHPRFIDALEAVARRGLSSTSNTAS